MSVGVAFITHNSKHHLKYCLPPILNSPLKPKVIIVNSSGEELDFENVIQIPKAEYNHGLTREFARKQLNTDIVVMMTPDAYAIDENVLEKLIAPLLNNQTSISYARQIPHEGANFFEAFARYYNYPPESHIRSIQDIDKYGVYTFFSSDSCAAYKQKALDEIGGFPHVLVGEDTVACLKLLQKGHKIAYVAEAQVRHSHRYTLLQEFRRSFDTGLARKDLLPIEDTKRGRDYVLKMTKVLAKQSPHLIPYGIVQSFAKWLGYKIGSHSKNAPLAIKKAFTSQSFYWE